MEQQGTSATNEPPAEMEERLAALETRLKASEKQIEELKRKEKSVVIFSVMIQKGGAHGPFNTDVLLTYDTVITNIGNSYHKATGIFIAPVAGVYYFTFFYHARGEHKTALLLHKNGDAIVKSSSNRSNCSSNGGNAALLQLKEGDQVYVHLLAGSYIWASEFHTTFSGFLVSQT